MLIVLPCFRVGDVGLIKKLRKRLMIIIMTVLIVIITGILVSIYVMMYNSEKESAQEVLEFAVSTAILNFTNIDSTPPEQDNMPFGADIDTNRIEQEQNENSDANIIEEYDEADKVDNNHDMREDNPSEIPNMDDGNPKADKNDNIQFGRFNQFASNNIQQDMMSGWILVQTSEDGEMWIFHSQINRDENGEYTSGTTELDSSVAAAAQKVIDNGDDSGFIVFDGTNYRYVLRENENGYRIVFLDRTTEISTLGHLLFILIIIFIGAIVLSVTLGYFLSRWAAKPIEDAWNRQAVFFSNASHELKTPLTVISANLDVIMSNPDKTVHEQEKWFGYVTSESAKMSQLINEMLYIAREDAQPESKPIMSEFDFSELVEGACLTFEALAFERGRMLEQNIGENITVKGEKESLQRVVHILIDNAISHSSPNSTINIVLKHSKHGKVKLAVSNEGENIPPESLNKIFDRYYRTDSSRSKDTGGFGLGLAIAKTIIEKHDGNIYATSENGITTFTIVI